MKLFKWGRPETPVRSPRLDEETSGYAFRRSRTLTGSASTQVRAAGESSRAQLKSPRLREHELKKHRNKLGFAWLGALICVGIFFWLVSNFSAGDAEIRSGTQLSSTSIDAAKYQTLINTYYASRPLERFRFGLDERSLLAYLQMRASEIKNVRIDSGDGIGKSVATLTFREPLIGWQIRGETYYIDGDGTAFRTNYFGSPSVTVQDTSGINPSEGVIASNRFLSFLGKVVGGVNTSGIGTVTKVVLPPNTSREVDITLAGKKAVYKLQMDREPTGQVADVVAMVKYLQAKSLDPEYVDVRVPSRGYYR